MNKNSLEDIKPESLKFNGFFRGIVEDIDDPLKVGRIRVRIFGLHTPELEKDEFEGIPTNELPWAEPCLGLLEGSMSGYGFFNVPLKGSHVMLFFENGFHTQPRYFATMPGIPTTAPDNTTGFNDPDGVYPDKLNESDFNRLARGVSTDTIVETKNNARETGIIKHDDSTWDEPESAYNATYPNNIVLSTHGGTVIEIDSTPNNERLHVYHPTNNFIEIKKNGYVVIKNSKSKYEIVVEDKNIYVKQDENTTVDGYKTERVALDKIEKIVGDKIENIDSNKIENITVNKTENIEGNKTENIEGVLTLNVEGNININSSSIINATAPEINVKSPSVSLGAPSNSDPGFPGWTPQNLVDDRIINKYNNHTHYMYTDEGGAQYTASMRSTYQVTIANACSSCTKAN